ncbi:MAG TPA: ABC transporter permease subunit [Candidatus Limnocylindrales bacterium]|nr:ABC transporter permease subunit [Candidatus Limnocylindrales bacterium]
MTGARLELVLGPFRQMRRSLLGWAIGLGALVAVTVAFWPVFRDSSGISEAIDQLPAGIIEAFGLAGFGTPAGFLRGNLYEFIVPLLLAVAAVGAANGLTSAEEDSGRLELYLGQPVTRQSLFIGRSVALAAWLTVLTAVVLLVQLASGAAVGLEVDTARVVSTVVLCGSLALLIGAVALAVAGWVPRPALVLAVGIVVAVGGYLVAALLPLSDALEPLSRVSPWSWALGGDPLVNPAEPWRYAALLAPALVLALIGVAGFVRRDVRAA